jgi:hypothetical protein
MQVLNQKILFTKEECDDIINTYTSLPITGTGDDTFQKYVYRDVNYETHGWIIERFIKWIETETSCKIEWGLSTHKEFYFQTYIAGDKFMKHNDSKYDRLYSVGLLLNDEFSGGDFIVDISKNQSMLFDNTVGNCYFFEARHEHELKEVTNGIRHIILVFFKKQQVTLNINKLL